MDAEEYLSPGKCKEEICRDPEGSLPPTPVKKFMQDRGFEGDLPVSCAGGSVSYGGVFGNGQMKSYDMTDHLSHHSGPAGCQDWNPYTLSNWGYRGFKPTYAHLDHEYLERIMHASGDMGSTSNGMHMASDNVPLTANGNCTKNFNKS